MWQPATTSVTVTDDNGCSIVSSTFTINQPDAIVVNGDVTNETQGGDGAIDLTVSGGTPGYTYNWTGPNGYTGTDEPINNLNSGTYNVTVTDDANCTQTSSFVVNSANAPSPILVSSTPVTCFGGDDGTITISVNGGTPEFMYTWSEPGVTGPNATGAFRRNI